MMSVKVIYKDIVPSGKDDISNIEVSEINSNIANTELLKVSSERTLLTLIVLSKLTFVTSLL